MKTLRRILLVISLLLLGTIGTCAALFIRTGPDLCAEPSAPASRDQVALCVEQYIRDQWYTDKLGKLGALESDPHGHGSWWEIASTHRKTLARNVSELCTHPRDEQGALGYTALVQAMAGTENECRAFSVTPLLGVSQRGQTCAVVRANASCKPR